MIEVVILFLIGTLISASCLWAGMKITKVDGSFLGMLAIAGTSGALGYIPLAGWLLGLVAMFALICVLTDANFWPDAILLVLVAKAFSIGVTSFFLSILAASA